MTAAHYFQKNTSVHLVTGMCTILCSALTAFFLPQQESILFNTQSITFCQQTQATGIPVDECEALVALYASTNGQSWFAATNWLSTLHPVNDWLGVTVTNGHVSHLHLQSNNLSGKIPENIGKLTQLEGLYLFNNNISGKIPHSIGNLSVVKYLYVFGNNLTGPLPASLQQLSAIEYLSFQDNDYIGVIPDFLTNIDPSDMVYMNGRNTICGYLPSGIEIDDVDVVDLELCPEFAGCSIDRDCERGLSCVAGVCAEQSHGSARNSTYDCTAQSEVPVVECEALVALYEATDGDNWNNNDGWLDQNVSIGGWKGVTVTSGSITTLDLNNNQLSGPIPSEIGNLSKLTKLKLTSNQLSGPIPSEIGNLSNLTRFLLYENQLTGPIPSEIGNLPKLTNLYLYYNQYTGAVPSFLTNINQTEYLYINGTNTLCGAIPQGVYPDDYDPQNPDSSDLPLCPEFAYCNVTTDCQTGLTCTNNICSTGTGSCNIPPTVTIISPNNGDSFSLGSSIPIVYEAIDTDGYIDRVEFFANGSLIETSSSASGTFMREPTQAKTYPIQVSAFDNQGQGIDIRITIIIDNTSSSPFDCSNTSQTGVPKEECESLVALYNSTDGKNRINNKNLNWLTNELIDNWGGITVVSGHVTEIGLEQANLTGPLPSVFTFPQLKKLYLYENKLSGNLDIQSWNIPTIEVMRLSRNVFTGPIPNTLGTLIHLEDLRLNENKFIGPFPPEIGNLPLTRLSLNSNLYSGAVPSFLNDIATIYINGTNDLCGGIPTGVTIKDGPVDRARCELGEYCNVPSDCTSGTCANNICIASSGGANIPPTIQITSPADNSTFDISQNPITFTAQVIDPDSNDTIDKVEFKSNQFRVVAGSLVSGTTGTYSAQYTFTNTGTSRINPLIYYTTSNGQTGSHSGSSGIKITITDTGPITCTNGAINSPTCNECPSSTYRIGQGCASCIAKFYCPGGVENEAKILACTENHYCPVNSGSPVACPVGYTSPVGSDTLSDCIAGNTNTPPIIEIISPSSGESFLKGENITFEIAAIDDSGIQKVELFNGSTLLGQTTTANTQTLTYNIILYDMPIGTHTITAKATDTDNISVSGEISITIKTSTCNAGTYRNSTNEVCSICEKGYYCEGGVAEGAIQNMCPEYMTSDAGSKNISDCHYLYNCAEQTQISTNECNALIEFYYATHGDNWLKRTNWLNKTTLPSQRYGVTIAGGTVTALNLSYNGLYGNMIPESIGALENLSSLNLRYNAIKGPIPQSIGNLTQLEHLNLRTNKFDGKIPSSLGNLSTLKTLRLGQNKLTGAIPTTLNSLTNLTYLDLGENQLSGELQGRFGNLMGLTYLGLQWNKFSGTYPIDLGNLSSLGEFFIQHNTLIGAIPLNFANFANGPYDNHMVNGTNLICGAIPGGVDLDDVPSSEQATCPIGASCNSPSDCTSGICTNNICA